MEEGGKEVKRGPFRGQNFCRLEEGFGGSGVRGVGVEGGVRAVTWGWPAKKTPPPPPPPRFLFDLVGNWKKARKGLLLNLFVYP